MKLEEGKIYTQQQIISSGNKKIIDKYKMTKESARLSLEANLLSIDLGGRKNMLSFLEKNKKDSKYKRLYEFTRNDKKDYESPQWHAYF